MALAVLVRFILLYWLYRAANNFDKGLKEHIFDIGVDEMDFMGKGTPIQAINSNGEIYDTSDYHRFDDKHVIVENKSAGVDKDDISQTLSKNNNNGSRLGDANHSIGGAQSTSKFSSDFGHKKKLSQASVNSSQNTSNFTRTRLDSDEFD